MRFQRAVPFAIVAAVVFQGAAAFAQSPAPDGPPNGDDIYDKTRAAVAAEPRPAYIAFTADFTFDRKGKVENGHERILVRARDGHALVRQVPDSPRDRVDQTPRVVTRGATDDPSVAMPLATFGLRPRTTAATEFMESSASPQPDVAGGPKVVGSVRAVDRIYTVTLAGDAEVAGHTCYHLVLVPNRDPQAHIIRELYVDKTSFIPQRYVIEVYAIAGPLKKSLFITCDASVVGDYTILTRAETSFTFRALFFSYGGTGRYIVHDVSFPQTLPDWLFDPDAFAQHKGDPIPD
jgi:hypothetical protein